MIRSRTRGEWGLRLLAAAGPVLALLATGPAGAWPAAWLVLVVGALSVGYAVAPETAVGTVAMAAVLCWWALAFRADLRPEAVAAAAALVAAHVAGVLVSYGPAGMAVDPATVRLWARRGAAVLVVAPLSWLVAELLRGQPEPGGIWVAGLAAALVAVAFGWVGFRLQDPDE